MDSEMISLINSVGFPIVMCLLMYKQNSTTIEMFNKTFESFRTVIEKNTTALSDLVEEIHNKKGVD